MPTIDLNCDMGEGFGNDAELMKYISSANVACGFHAGDAQTMRTTVQLALEHDVAIGAHPGYRDPENFGRNPINISSKEVFDIVVEQLEVMADICNELGAALHHVKPHGALYNQAAGDNELAAAIAEAVFNFDQGLILYGLSGSCLISAAETIGLRTASEVFADRTYQVDGSLTPRNRSNALITDRGVAVAQVLQMIRSGSVTAVSGQPVPIKADTVCIHGDGEHAVDFARSLRRTLEEFAIEVKPFCA
jgi:5-oxoprolinase (ATP-hydrolysing) subunit A